MSQLEIPFLARLRRLNENAIAAGRLAEDAARRRRRAPLLPIGAVATDEAPDVAVNTLFVMAILTRRLARRPATQRSAASPISGRSQRKPP